MGEWLVSIAGTPQGAQLATVLALVSAIAHAFFGALQKGRHDPWLSRGVIDFCLAVMSAPIALFLVPWPTVETLWLLLASVVIHFFYKLSIALSYERAAYTVVYPVVRGIGPLITVIAAVAIFSERFTALQWLGVACLSGGILLLAGRNLAAEKLDPASLKVGLAWAVTGGVLVALYTTFDAFAIRATPDPFTFIAWLFFLSSLDFPFISLWRYRRAAIRPAPGPLLARGVLGAVVAWISFGGVMLATRLDSVGEAAVLRETSTVFAALIGWVVLREKTGPGRVILMALIALGAVIVKLGG
ncbi:MAG: EamA family transporter [Paracoccaceae bacterium]